jgi:transcriptional regulator with XRE-family HTH domain
MATKKLGDRLKTVRELKELSLAAVAEPAGMSATYLQKLERGDVESPSPHRLYALSKELDVDYADLMQLAGYVVPARENTDGKESLNLLAQALSANNLSEEELADLADYLRFRRYKQARRRT